MIVGTTTLKRRVKALGPTLLRTGRRFLETTNAGITNLAKGAAYTTTTFAIERAAALLVGATLVFRDTARIHAAKGGATLELDFSITAATIAAILTKIFRTTLAWLDTRTTLTSRLLWGAGTAHVFGLKFAGWKVLQTPLRIETTIRLEATSTSTGIYRVFTDFFLESILQKLDLGVPSFTIRFTRGNRTTPTSDTAELALKAFTRSFLDASIRKEFWITGLQVSETNVLVLERDDAFFNVIIFAFVNGLGLDKR